MTISAAIREAEKTIIGSILAGRVTPLDTGLKGTEFVNSDFRDIFVVCNEISQSGGEIDFLTVSQKLALDAPNNSPAYIPPTPKALAALAADNATFSLTPSVQVLTENASRGRLKDLFTSAAAESDSSASPLDLINRIENEFNQIRQTLGSNVTNLKHVSEIAPLMKEIYKELASGVSHNLPTGITAIDAATGGGGARGDVWVIGAPTGGGKSALALQMARNQSEQGVTSLIISREMLDIENFKRLHSSIGDIPLWTVKSNMYAETYNRLLSTIDDVSKQNIWIDSTSADMAAISRSIKEAVKTRGVEVVYVDYLQLLSGVKGTRMSRADEVAYCSRTLKELAMQTGTLIVSLAQYNRSASYAGQAENHSFAESSAIEKDASIVLHLELEKKELAENELPDKWRKAVIRIGKARNSAEQSIYVWYRGETFTFTKDDAYPYE